MYTELKKNIMSRKCMSKRTFSQVIEECFCEFDVGTFFLLRMRCIISDEIIPR